MKHSVDFTCKTYHNSYIHCYYLHVHVYNLTAHCDYKAMCHDYNEFRMFTVFIEKHIKDKLSYLHSYDIILVKV